MSRSRVLLLIVLVLLALVACGSEPASDGLVNGCKRAEIPLSSDQEVVEVRFGGLAGYYSYEPACLRVRAGTRVRFVGPFNSHPLAAGRVSVEEVLPDPESPIKSTWKGESVTFQMVSKGTVGYYCDQHAFEGMFGAVFVE